MMADVADLYSVPEAAAALGVNDARVKAMIRDGTLDADKVAGRWLISREAIEGRRRRAPGRGRPLLPASAWRFIGDRSFAGEMVSASTDERDRWRRKLGGRADVRTGYLHPSLLEKLVDDERLVPAGRAAADLAGVPAGANPNYLDAYTPASFVQMLDSRRRVEWDAASANVRFRVVSDDLWPVPTAERFSQLLLAWCDLADDGDRAADMVFAALAGEMRRRTGPPVG